MPIRKNWTRQQLLVAFKLYCQMPFGKMHSRNPEIIKIANSIDRTPSALAMKLTNIASLDPEITSTGRTGLSGVSTNDRAMWEEMHSNWESFVVETQKAEMAFQTDPGTQTQVDDDLPMDDSPDYTGVDKDVRSTTRIGQNFFRQAILSAYRYQCCITGLAIPKLLIASHIVPWHKDKKNRLNPRNGLCLSVLHDKAFDVGLLTITENMTVKISRLNNAGKDSFFASALLAYEGKPILLPEKFQPDKNFLAYHRQNVYESWS